MSRRSGFKATASLDLVISVILILIVAAYLSNPAVRYLLVAAAILLGLLGWFRFRAKTRASHMARGELRLQLEQNQTRLNELISQIPGVVWEADLRADGTLAMSFISNYVEKMLGYSVSEWIQIPHFWMNAIHNEDQPRVTREISNIFQTGGGRTKFRWLAKDGHSVWVETHVAITHDSHGVAKGMRGVTMDITARLYAEETLRDKEARLQIALSAALMKSWQWDVVSGSLMWDDTKTTWADFLGLVLTEDQATLRNAVERVLQDRQTLDVEFRIAGDDGIRWLTLKANVFSGEDGRPANITGVSMDITDRRKSAEALRASEERYRLAARASNDAIWDWDLATGEVQWNEGVRTLFGYTAAEVGSDIEWRLSQIHPDDRERVVSGINSVMKGGGRYWSDEYRFRCADGSYATVTDRAYIEQNEYGRAVRLIAAMTDITRLKQAAREREQLLRLEQTARKQAESANRLKDEFLATLSHELRTPITPILGWTQLLRNRTADATFLDRGLTVIEQNARSQAKLIDELLDVSRIVTGKMQLKIQNVQAQNIIQAVVDSVQPAADGKGIRLETSINRSKTHITADPDRLQQVIWNLLSNAIKFTPAGGVIRVSSETTPTEMRIVVSDTGEGIAPEFLPHVFERFSQADSTNVRVHGGLGVGLAIVRYIVELHGGTVTVDSPGRGAGSTFTVTIPVRATLAAKAKKSKRLSKTLTSLTGVRLLVVDDEPHTKELLALVLQQEGAIVNTAESVAEALHMLEVEIPDILISDIAMPTENGYDLLQKVRRMEALSDRRRVPAIALTAFAQEDDRRRAFEAGFDMHLSKPVESEKLISAILELATRYLGKAG